MEPKKHRIWTEGPHFIMPAISFDAKWWGKGQSGRVAGRKGLSRRVAALGPSNTAVVRKERSQRSQSLGYKIHKRSQKKDKGEGNRLRDHLVCIVEPDAQGIRVPCVLALQMQYEKVWQPGAVNPQDDQDQQGLGLHTFRSEKPGQWVWLCLRQSPA